jgi:hypothetical protein
MTINWTADTEAKMTFKELKEKFGNRLSKTLDSSFKTVSINDPEIPDDATVYIDGFGFSVLYTKIVMDDGNFMGMTGERKVKKSLGGTISREA